MWKTRVFIIIVGLSSPVLSLGTYNDACTPSTSFNDGCDLSYGFRCHPDQHVCRCYDETSMIYDQEKGACIINTVGASCDANENGWRYPFLQCADPLSCTYIIEDDAFICRCHWDYLLSPDDLSVINATARCLPANKNIPCDAISSNCHESTGLTCQEGRCQCPHPLSQIFSTEASKCLGIPEATNGCDLERGGECVDNSYCGQDKKCHCNPGYSATFDFPSSCKLHYGQPCNAQMYQPESCNEDRGFQCLKGRCSCKQGPDAQYDPELQVCAALEGYTCGLGRKDAEISQDYPSRAWKNYAPCLTGLECVSSGTNPNVGICFNSTSANKEKVCKEGGENEGKSNGKDDDEAETGNESVILIFKMFK